MSRYTDANCKLCRREGQKLFLKGERCFKGVCAFEKRPVAPGQHGMGRKKVSEYGMQLKEKQKLKFVYGVLEKQFSNYYKKAERMEGMAGENLITLLESRLDNIAFRMGLSMTRREARQLVSHAHFTVNGKKVNIPSYLVKAGDVIAISEKSMTSVKFKGLLEANASLTAPAWLSVDSTKGVATVAAMPKREDIDYEVEEHLIVELYSK